jgi:peptidyl-prolyl cis-trans isomerase C
MPLMHPSARLVPLAALLCLAAGAYLVPAAAQTAAPGSAPPAAAAPGAPPAAANPVVGRVGSIEIRLSDLDEEAQGLPADMHSMPKDVLYPMLLDQEIDRASIAALARQRGLDKDADIKRQMDRAADQALENALMARVIGPQVTDEAVRARYNSDVAGKPGETEVHARHILVSSEDEAKKIIAELKAGGDFAAIAKAKSADPGAAHGGDLGFFKRGDMVPEFAAAAFALKPGEISQTPVKTQFGWHIIKVEEVRQAPPQTFEQARGDLRQKMIHENVEKVLAEAHAAVKVEKFNLDGSVPRATDSAAPPPASKP